MKIAVPAPGESIGPQSPTARVTELQQALLVLGFKIGTPDGIYGGKTATGHLAIPEAAQARAGRAGRAEDREGDQQGAPQASRSERVTGGGPEPPAFSGTRTLDE